MTTHPFRSALGTLGIVLVVVLIISAGAAVAMRPGPVKYTQIIIGVSPSEAQSRDSILACAHSAAKTAIKNAAIVDVATVSAAPADMEWKRIDARQSLWTRLTIAKARDQRRADLGVADATIASRLNGRRPEGSSDQLSALSAAAQRAQASANDIPAGRRTVVVCADAHWTGAGSSAYSAKLDSAGTARILDHLRSIGLLADWRGATITFDKDTADRVADLHAARETAIRQFWIAWGRAARGNVVFG